jgi:hypothetical protein
MQKSSYTQIIPFPLPAYLATFFATQITTKPVLTKDGSYAKPFSVRRDSKFGDFLLRHLSKTNKVKVKEGFTFYIEVSEPQTIQSSEIVDARSSFVEFSEESILEITKIFKTVFESHLTEHVMAFYDGVKFINPTKQRGIKREAIFNFCKKYGVKFSNKNLSTWEKMIQRYKSSPNNLKIKML